MLSTDSQERKDTPVYSGFMSYFPLAIAEVARLSQVGNEKHSPGKEITWNRGVSEDHADCMMRHQLEIGIVDTDGFLHEVKVAWRAMAQLQTKLEQDRGIFYGKAAKDPIDMRSCIVEEYSTTETGLTGLLKGYTIRKQLEK